MKYILFSLLIFLNLTHLTGQNNELVTMPDLAQKITYFSDQYEAIRSQKNEMLLKHKPASPEIKQLDTRLADQMKLNYEAARKMLEANGFPNHDMVGAEVTHKFWQIVQPMDQYPDFQMQVLRGMAGAVDAGKASWIDFAYLTDRVLLNQQRPQHYGTQVFYDENTKTYKPHPVDDLKQTNERRVEIGLPVLKEFLVATNKKYEGPIQQKSTQNMPQFQQVRSADSPGGTRRVRNY